MHLHVHNIKCQISILFHFKGTQLLHMVFGCQNLDKIALPSQMLLHCYSIFWLISLSSLSPRLLWLHLYDATQQNECFHQLFVIRIWGNGRSVKRKNPHQINGSSNKSTDIIHNMRIFISLHITQPHLRTFYQLYHSFKLPFSSILSSNSVFFINIRFFLYYDQI